MRIKRGRMTIITEVSKLALCPPSRSQNRTVFYLPTSHKIFGKSRFDISPRDFGDKAADKPECRPILKAVSSNLTRSLKEKQNSQIFFAVNLRMKYNDYSTFVCSSAALLFGRVRKMADTRGID